MNNFILFKRVILFICLDFLEEMFSSWLRMKVKSSILIYYVKITNMGSNACFKYAYIKYI